MARPTIVKHYQRPGRDGWYVTCRTADGGRLTHCHLESVTTEISAVIIARDLQTLQERRIVDLADCPPEIRSHARKIYWRLPELPAGDDRIEDLPLEGPGWSAAELRALPKPLRQHVLDQSLDLISQRDTIADLRANLAAAQADLATLRSSIHGREVEASRRCPPMPEALEAFRRSLVALAPKTRAEYIASAEAFVNAHPKITTTAAISAATIHAWTLIGAENTTGPNTRINRRRLQISRFVNWAAKAYGYESQMENVDSPKMAHVRRERGEIIAHPMPEILRYLAGLEPYWGALIGCMALAGLRANEVRSLRPYDYFDLSRGRKGIRVAPTAGNKLKTDHSRRIVPCSQPLRTLLQMHLDLNGAGEQCLFPARNGGGRPRKNRESWSAEALTHRLHDYRERPGLLPAGWDAYTLRHSISTAWSARGMDPYTIAMLLGNTPAVVVAHYAARRPEDINTEI